MNVCSGQLSSDHKTILLHWWLLFMHEPLGFTHGPSIKLKPAARCCCPDSPRAARVSATASSKSAGRSVVQTMTLAAGSSVSAALSWHGDIWPRFLSGSERRPGRHGVLNAWQAWQARFMSGIFTTVLHPHAGSLWCVYRCRAPQSAPTVLKPSNPEAVKRESAVSQQQVETLHEELCRNGSAREHIFFFFFFTSYSM